MKRHAMVRMAICWHYTTRTMFSPCCRQCSLLWAENNEFPDSWLCAYKSNKRRRSSIRPEHSSSFPKNGTWPTTALRALLSFKLRRPTRSRRGNRIDIRIITLHHFHTCLFQLTLYLMLLLFFLLTLIGCRWLQVFVFMAATFFLVSSVLSVRLPTCSL